MRADRRMEQRSPSAGPDGAPAALFLSGCGQDKSSGKYERPTLHQGASAPWHGFGDPDEQGVRSHRMSWS
jgi:hypothetical protein